MEKTAEIIRQYFFDNQLRLAEGTMKNDRYILQKFFSFCRKEYDQIKPDDIRNWLNEQENSGIKAATLYRCLTRLKAFYFYCLEEELVGENPVVKIKPPAPAEALPFYLEAAQLAELREMASNHPRERAIIEVLYATGVRISELVNLRKEDINWPEKTILIRCGKGAKDSFTPECAARLKHYLATRSDQMPYLFINKRGGRLRPARVQLYFSVCSKELGFRVTPHVLRHTFAAHLAQRGMPLSAIQDLLGHDSVKNTRIYTKLFAHARNKQYDKYR